MIARDQDFDSMPVITADERAEVDQEMTRLAAELAPCGNPEEVNKLLGTIASAYPAGKMTQAEADMQNRVYCDALKDIPLFALRRAFREAVKRFKFFPTVAEIRELAQVERRKIGGRYNKLKLIAFRHDLEHGAAQQAGGR